MNHSHIPADALASSKATPRVPRLPACQSCHRKKIKCDNVRPKCTPCIKSGNACMTVDVDGRGGVSREYIYQLEQSVSIRQQELSGDESGVEPSRTAEYPDLSVVDCAEATGEESAQDTHSTPAGAERDGISFMSSLFTDSGWKNQNLKLLQNLSRSSAILETSVETNSLPSAEEAQLVFNNYLTAQVQNPFLLSRDVQRLYHTVFSAQQTPNVSETDRLSKSDLFRTYLILAIGSVTLYRSGAHSHHPYGYFLAGIQHLEDDLFSRGLSSIQHLLLVVRFGIYYHIGTSIWELASLCMRMCIEQRLHMPSRKQNIPFLQEHLQRRVFWGCYIFDRYSSITLGRPLAISDEEIKVGFPANANDKEVEAAGLSGSFSDFDDFCRATTTTAAATTTTIASSSSQQQGSSKPTEMAIFLFCIQLRRITSRIHAKFQQKQAPARIPCPISSMELVTASGRIYADLNELLSELEQWRALAPVFPNPHGLYESQEWHDLLLMRERLLLIRKAIDLVPKRNNTPPRDLLSLCFKFAIETIMTFCRLFDQGIVTYTRSYFQTLFTAGLSVMCSMYVVAAIDHNSNRDDRLATAIEALNRCETALKRMGKSLPDAMPYVTVYEVLRGNIEAKLNSSTTTAPLRTADEDGELHHHQRHQHHQHHQHHHHIQGPPRSWVGPYDKDGDMLYSHNESASQQPPEHISQQSSLLFGNIETHQQQLWIPGNDQQTQIDPSLLSMDLFSDNLFWDMEAGLGEYAYGDPMLLFQHVTDDNS